MRRIISVVAVLFLLGVLAAAASLAAETADAKTEKEPGSSIKTDGTKVSIEADDAKIKDLFNSVADQSKKKIVVESTVKGTVPHISAKDVTVESALTVLCKAGKCEWRKVYIASDSKLLEQPDRLASTVRLVSAMGFPEMLIPAASNGKLAAHYTQEKTVKSVQDLVAKDSALSEVYVITNDAAVAEKEKEKEDQSGSKALEEYNKQQQEMMDKFIKMTPEEQEQAILAGINLFENMDPSYMASAMRAMSKMDPDVFARMANRGTDMLMSMSTEDRRAMMKMQMRMAAKMSPEMQQMLGEDAKAVVEELQQEKQNAPTPPR